MARNEKVNTRLRLVNAENASWEKEWKEKAKRWAVEAGGEIINQKLNEMELNNMKEYM